MLYCNGWDGVSLTGESDLVMEKSFIVSNKYNGVDVHSAGRAIIKSCFIHKNRSDGIVVNKLDAPCKFSNNTISENSGYGVVYNRTKEKLVKPVLDNMDTVEKENTISDNAKGEKNVINQ